MVTKKDVRARVWTMIVYPDSAPKDWRDVLDGYHVPWVESPLHDQDTNPDGSIKKSHWHIVLFFEGKKSYTQVSEIASSLNGPIPQKVPSPKGMVRYLIHMDNPEKHQYSRGEIKVHQGAEVESYFELSFSSRLETLSEMIQFIRDSDVDNYSDFLGYCLDHNEKEWLNIAVNYNTLAINKLIDAVYQKNHPKAGFENGSLSDKVAQVKELREKGVKLSVIADTVGVSLATVKRYLKK